MLLSQNWIESYKPFSLTHFVNGIRWNEWHRSQVNDANTRAMYESCSKLTIKTPEHRQNTVNDAVLVSLLLTLSRFYSLSWYFHCWLWKSKCQLGFVSILSSIPQHLKSSEILRTIYVKWVQLNQSNSHIATKIYRFHLTFVTINKPHNQSDLNSQKNSNFLFQVLQVSVKLIHTKSWW